MAELTDTIIYGNLNVTGDILLPESIRFVDSNIKIGQDQSIEGENSINIGEESLSGNLGSGSGDYHIAIGYGASTRVNNSSARNNMVAIGYNASATLANDFVLGNNNNVVKIPGSLQVSGLATALSEPTESSHIARLNEVNTVQTNLENHAGLTNPHSAVSTATANRLILRDDSGRARVEAPMNNQDIARKQEVDNVQTNLDNHANLTNPHEATSENVVNTLMLRDAFARAKVNAPSHSSDIARKLEVDAVQTNLDNHANLTNPHNSTSSVTVNRLILRDASGRARVNAPSHNDDIARKFEVDQHAGSNIIHVYYGTTTGSANNYSVTLSPAPTSYQAGMALAVRINIQNTGASTINVNGLGAKSIRKPNGNTLSGGNLQANSVYSMRYNGTNFILQGSDSEGDAALGDVLAGKTFSNDTDTGLTGTMPNRTGHVTGQSHSTTEHGMTLRFRPQEGFYPGDADNSVQRSDINFISSNIKPGVSIFGLTSTMSNRTGHVTGQSHSRDGTTLRFRPLGGFYPGDADNSVQMSDSNFIEGNIRNGVNIFGLAGTWKGYFAVDHIIQFFTSTSYQSFSLGTHNKLLIFPSAISVDNRVGIGLNGEIIKAPTEVIELGNYTSSSIQVRLRSSGSQFLYIMTWNYPSH